MDTFEICRVIEYSAFFPELDPIDLQAVLKSYDREELIKMALLLSLHYGNLYFPNSESTLFSEASKGHMADLEEHCALYFKHIGLEQGSQVVLVTQRTSLELLRNIFAIPKSDYQDTILSEDKEFMLFKVILTLNEKIMAFGDDAEYKLDELFFLNSYLTNDCNNYTLQSVLQPQLYYFKTFVEFIPKNAVLLEASEILFSKWGISSWKEYWATIIMLAYDTEKYRKKHQKGLPIINVQNLEDNDETGLFSSSLVDSLSISVEDDVAYEDIGNGYDREQNIDYRIFRSKPFVKLSNGQGYVVANIELLCERLFNSLYFDFLPLINGKKGSVGFFDFNKNFIEKVLFRKTMFHCFTKVVYTYPQRNMPDKEEDKDEPDFYGRTGCKILIAECKAIKMNGIIRDKGDYKMLLENLFQKLALKTRNLDAKRKYTDKVEPIGVGQLLKHIDSIESDNFKWDSNIPDQVAYYPILVLEDVRFLQPGLMSILNKWFMEVAQFFPEINFCDIVCKPVMVCSINTLYLYDRLIRSRGLTNLIDSFLTREASIDNQGNYILKPTADFDSFLRCHRYNKANTMGKEISEWLTTKHD